MKFALDGLNIRRGGGETVLLRVAEGFARSGHDVVVFTAGGRIASELHGLESPRIEIREVSAAASALGALRYRYAEWDAACRDLGCEAAFGFNYWIPTALPQATYHINVIPFLSLRERIAAVGSLRAVVLARYARLALRRSQINLFESKHVLGLARAVARRPIRNPHVAYIGVDHPPKLTPRATPSTRYIAAVTSPAPHKHNEHLFALHRRLNRDRAPAERIGLRLIGVTAQDLAERRETQAETDYALGQPDVEMLGYLGRESLYRELGQALALVSFSELESFYMVALEAMAVGCPTITTDISSVAESVGDAGLKIPCGAVADAAELVERLEDESFRSDVVRRSRAHAAKFYADDCARRIVALTVAGLSAQ